MNERLEQAARELFEALYGNEFTDEEIEASEEFKTIRAHLQAEAETVRNHIIETIEERRLYWVEESRAETSAIWAETYSIRADGLSIALKAVRDLEACKS